MDGLQIIQRLLTLSILLVSGISSAALLGANPIYHPKCWDPTVPSLAPATFTNCLEAINKVVIGRDPEEVLRFSVESSQRPDIKLPTTWTIAGESCMVGLQWKPTAPRRGDDRTNLLDIKGAAMAAAIRCIIRPPHLGGTVVVGWNQHMVVSVLNLNESERSRIEANSTLSTQ
ncbi:MAG: hypothetical protein Q9216_006066 [Gyalolechia sp. 2 TL-2023]